MRVTSAFNRVLCLIGAVVVSVAFTDEGIVLGVRRRARLHRCPCGRVFSGRYDQRRRRWRHLDMGGARVWLEADIARVACPSCGVRTEQVPWARSGARLTQDFEDVVAWLAQRMDKTAISQLMRCSWEAVDAVVKRVVAEKLDPPDGARLDGLYRIGIDEISYKRGHKYLTVVADHDTGRVVWVSRDRTQEAVEEFLDALGPQRSAQVEAVSLDGSSIYRPVVEQRLPQAKICLDPFHVVKWVGEAMDSVYQSTPSMPAEWNGRWFSRHAWRRTRTVLRLGQEKLTNDQREMVNSLRRGRYRLFRAWELKESFRRLYTITNGDHARLYLKDWLTSARRSRIPQYKNLARRLEKHFDTIVNAIRYGLSNSRLEGINAKIRVIQRRGYGHPDPEALEAMIYLCLGGIEITLPKRSMKT